MKIDVVTVMGSPKNIIPDDIHGRGVGGAELALMSWAEIMSKRGHSVRVYNQTTPRYWDDVNLQYRPDYMFNPGEDRDILITFRGPNEAALGAKGKQFGWSCDQYTVGDYHSWYRDVEKMVFISSFHQQDHLNRYGQIAIDKGQVIDLGVRTWEYSVLPKEPYSFIFCSVPDRGLNELANIWPRIREEFPLATLTVTSDYTLWGATEPLNMQYRMRLAGQPGIRFLGNIPRQQLVDEQCRAEVNLYPCNYDENFCIAIAECQVAGVYCITTDRGALKTTNMYGPRFPAGLDNTVSFMDTLQSFFNTPKAVRELQSNTIRTKALHRFSWDTIAEQWEQLFNG